MSDNHRSDNNHSSDNHSSNKNHNYDEQRQEHRLNTPLTVFIELAAATHTTPATIVISQSLDISTNGLRVITDHNLPTGSILSSCIQSQDSTQRFILITEVKWVTPWQNTGEYLVGLALFESENSDIQAWKEFIAQQYGRAENITPEN